jgi:DNA-directed RNA polymerase subunit RPC12/RpoP
MRESCAHLQTVQILGPVYKCAQCGEIYSDTNTPGIDADKYHRLQREREAVRRAAIARNKNRGRRPPKSV